MNNISIVGHTAKDFELSSIGQNNTTQARGTVAVRRSYKQNGEYKTDFFPVKAFGKTAEILATVRKGNRIALEGSIEIDSVKDEYNIWKTYVNLNVNKVTFIEKRQETNNFPSPYEQQPIRYQQQNNFVDIDDDDLPF